MSQSSDSYQKIVSGRQESFYIKVQEDDDIQPHQLSGDQSSERSVLLSDVAGGGKSNFMLTVTTIMKTVVGAGILALPYTISQLGYVFGLMVYLLVVAINQFTAVMLLKSKNLSRHSNYSTIMYHLFYSKAAQALSSAIILINNLGICIVQLTIFKEALHQIFQQVWPQLRDQFYVQEWFLILVLAALQLPFTIVQKIQRLKFMAFLGVTGIVVFICSLMIAFFDQMNDIEWSLKFTMQAFPSDWLKVASVTPNIMLALAYHMNFFPIYKGLKNCNDQKMSRASMVGLGIVAFFYILVGNVGYAMYGPNVQTNFLLNLQFKELNHVLYFTMNAGFLLSVFFSFPVMFFGARNNFIALIQMFKLRNKPQKVVKQNFKNSIQQISSYIQNGTRQEKKRKAEIYFYIFTGILFSVAVGIAIGIQDIESVFNLVGAIASNAIGFIFPCMFYFLLIQYKGKQRNIKFQIARFLTYFFIPFGVFAIVAKYI